MDALDSGDYAGAGVFSCGNAGRGHMEKSDIDLAVYGWADFDNFYYDIQEKVWTLLEFDIINMEERISESLRQEINRDGVVLYEKV